MRNGTYPSLLATSYHQGPRRKPLMAQASLECRGLICKEVYNDEANRRFVEVWQGKIGGTSPQGSEVSDILRSIPNHRRSAIIPTTPAPD